MNRILFEASQRADDGTVVLQGAEAHHIVTVLKAVPGNLLRLGEVDGLRYDEAEVLEVRAAEGVVRVRPGAGRPPLRRAPCDLLLALPRPQCLRRLLPQLAMFGVGRVYLTAGKKVEKAYWGSTFLKPELMRPLLLEGLMQAGDTLLPEVRLVRRLKPLVEDELPARYEARRCWFAHPDTPGDVRSAEAVPAVAPLMADDDVRAALAAPSASPGLLAIGPEGGWSPYEVQMFSTLGFRRVSLGDRIFRTDTAVVSLLARFG